MPREEELARLSEMAVNGRIVHKIDLIGMVKIGGVHYFNVYRRYNSVYEIVLEDSNGDFYLQKDSMLRDSIGAVLCLSQEQIHSMYTTEIFSFRHGGVPPTGSSAPENMCWSDVQEEWYAVEIHLKGILDMEEEEEDQEVQDDEDDEDDEDKDDEEDQEDEYADMPPLISDDEDEDEYADMPPLISDDEEESTDAVCPYLSDGVVCPSMTCHNLPFFYPVCGGKRTFLNYLGCVKKESSDEESDEEIGYESAEDEVSDDDESVGRGCGPDHFVILRNGTKYRKIR